MGQGRAAGLVDAETVSAEEGRARIDAGGATALLVIPEGFADAVLREKPAALTLRTNPAERILPGIVEEWLSVLVDGVYYAQRLLGEELQTMAEGPPDSSASAEVWVADLSVRMNRLASRTADWLSPLVIRLETTSGEEPSAVQAEAVRGKPERSIALVFVPGLLMMSLIFVAQNVAEDFWREREAGTLRRLSVAPHAMGAMLLGKVAFGATLMFTIALPALTAAWVFFGVSWVRLPLAAAWTVLGGVFLLALMIVLQLLASSRRMAHMMGMAFAFPLLMLGGSFFPFDIMPAGMAAIGRLTPNGWALARLVEIVLGEWNARTLLASAAGILAVVAALLAVSVWRLRTGFARG
jgi:ABC-type multidrug transport system permease subunit